MMANAMTLAPIVLFVFNRPVHTRTTLESLKANALASQSELFVYSDGSRGAKDDADVAAVRAIVDNIEGFKSVTVFKQSNNRGLAASVIAGVSATIERYGKVIVVEDDLQFSPLFLNYMNDALVACEKDSRVFSIGGYSPPLEMPANYDEDSYLSYRCCTWGWATWRDRWGKVDWDVREFDEFCKDETAIARFNRGGDDMFHILKLQMAGKISSWGIRWDYAHYKNEAYCFRPSRSIVSNIGNDGTGVHCGVTDKFDVDINMQSSFSFPPPGQLQLSDEINRRFATFYDGRPREGTEGVPTAKVSLVGRVMSRARRWMTR